MRSLELIALIPTVVLLIACSFAYMNTSILSMPFRALRFAWHLIKNGWWKLLLEEVLAEMASAAATPRFRQMKKLSWRACKIWSLNRIAVDSPDTAKPWGAARNWKTNRAFIVGMVRRYGPCGRFLDLGCSTGRMVKDFADIGWLSVGLEGSGYPERYRIGPWADAKYNLWSCDIGKHFSLSDAETVIRFDVLTAWQVLEHIDSARLETLCLNVRKHSDIGSIFVISTDNSSEMPEGIELHVTCWNRAQWLLFFSANLPEFELTAPLPWWQKMRRSNRGLDFVLKRAS